MKKVPWSFTGFTLIELIIVIVISGIIAVGATRFVAHTASGYVATALRQGNAAMGVIVSEKISRELRSALPNSVRVNVAQDCIEFVPVLAAAKYSAAPVVPLTADSSITMSYINCAGCSGSDEHAVIYPSSQADAYTQGSTTALTTAQATVASATSVTLASNHSFPADSPSRRLYIVGEPISYCYASESGENGIFRYSGYGFNTSMVSRPSGGTRSMLVNNVSANTVEFDVDPATLTRNALAEISFEVSVSAPYSAANESLYIDQEVQIRNVP